MKFQLLAAACVALTALAGCTVDSGPSRVVVVGDGSLVVDWTIEGAKDSRDCAAMGADSIDVVVSTAAGDFVGDFGGYCEDFAVDIQLAPGAYYGSATLLDAAGRPRTTSVDLGSFRILGDDELHVPIDFPLDSFF
ncbi:MAG TPA: hypothetical protein VLJ38_06275 [Polyangiaceae bacterium]|nr:hypothetical protein [Polyangiaceae bacterium]